MTTHPFVSTPNNGPCSSCGKLRSDSIHKWDGDRWIRNNPEHRALNLRIQSAAAQQEQSEWAIEPQPVQDAACLGADMRQTIELDCAPGALRPGDLIDGVIAGTGLEPKADCARFFGLWIWDYDDVPAEIWAKAKPILEKRITALHNQGAIRYGRW